MKVLVTGGAGLVGSHTAEYYAKRGHEVIAFDNLMRSKLFGSDKKTVEYNWNYLAKYENIKRIKGDVRSEKDVMKVIKGVDVVIHTAAQPGVPSSVRNPREDFDINAYGTLNVLECLRQNSPGATFIYCSTNKVYGENVDKYTLEAKDKRYIYKDIEGISETLSMDYTGHTPYGASKYVGDLYTQEYARLYGMKTAVFRMSCLSKDIAIATPQGHVKIGDIEGKKTDVYCYHSTEMGTSKTQGSFKTNNDGKILYNVQTKRGYQIKATGDHRFFTPGGYTKLEKINYGGLVAVCPEFFYIKRKHTRLLPKRTILSKDKFKKYLKEYRRREKSNLKYVRALEKRGLLSLLYNNPQIYIIARLVGYLTGDAHLYHRIRPSGKSYTEIQVYALKNELGEIKEDFRRLGFLPGKTRISSSKSELMSGHIIDGTSYKFSLTTTDAFAFFELLGVPVGHKSKIRFEIPEWIRKGPDDIQDEYLRGLFGAEMSKPHFYRRKGEESLDLQPLIFSQSKNKELAKNARHFRQQIRNLLKKRGIEARTQELGFFYKKGGDKSISFQLLIKPSRENFLRFANIGFAFNNERKKALYRIVEFLKTGLPSNYYNEWVKEHGYLLEDTNLLWDKMVSKKTIPIKEIFDITVPEHHNFIANGFLVHNCIYGTRQFGFEDQGWVAWFVIARLLNKPITIYGDGKQVRDLLYVEDLVRAYDLFVEGNIKHAVYNIGGGKNNTVSLLEFLDILEKQLGRYPKVTFSNWRRSDQKVYISDLSKIKEELNWKPTVSVCEGLKRLIEWVKQNKSLF